MKVFSVFILLTVAGCGNLPNKPEAKEANTVDCSVIMEELQSNLDAAKADVEAMGKISGQYPTEENNAKTADAAIKVATIYSMLDIARSDCPGK